MDNSIVVFSVYTIFMVYTFKSTKSKLFRAIIGIPNIMFYAFLILGLMMKSVWMLVPVYAIFPIVLVVTSFIFLVNLLG